jgi:fucose 4-O-acetylase-like acetyltransferase
MPAFVIISGYLFKNVYSLKDLTIKRSKRMLIPYFSFAILTLIIIQLQSYNLNEVPLYAENLVRGGRNLTYFYGVYWYITCLLLTTILFALMIKLMKNKFIVMSVVVLLYILAHLYVLGSDNKVFWSADTVLLTIFYFALGYYGRLLIDKINVLHGVIALMICTVLILCNYNRIFEYKLDIKSNQFNHIVLDILIPVVFFMLIAWISKLIQLINLEMILSATGKGSMTVMYLHLPIMIILRGYNVNEIVVVIVAIAIPMMCHITFDKINLFNVLFLGKQHKIRYKGESRSV